MKKTSIRRKLLSFAISLALVFSVMPVWQVSAVPPPGGDFAGGTGAQADPWIITTPVQLQALNNYLGAAGVGKYFRLANDIDLATYLSAAGAGYNGGLGWVPVGTAANPFYGNFEGGGHVVKNLVINNALLDFAGLFGKVAVSGGSGSLANLGLVDAVVTARQYAGTLAGDNRGLSISSCYSMATVVGGGAVTGTADVGGLIGLNEGVLTGCYAEGNVTGMQYVGGLAGASMDAVGLGTAPMLIRCYAKGNVSGMVAGGTGESTGGLVGCAYVSITECAAFGTVTGKTDTGGLVGYACTANTTITKSCATGTVTGSGNWTGGLVGQNSALMSTSYSTGTVTGTNAVGGLVGLNYTGGSIINCYCTGDVTGTGMHIGGLLGSNSATGVVSTSYSVSSYVIGNDHVGGLIGTANGTVTNCFLVYTLIRSGTPNFGQIVGYRAAALNLQCCYYPDNSPTTRDLLMTADYFTTNTSVSWSATGTQWDFASVWQIPTPAAYPVLRNFPAITGVSISGAPASPVDLRNTPVAPVTLTAALTPVDAVQPVNFAWSLTSKPAGSSVSVGYDGATKVIVPDMAGTYTVAVTVTCGNGGSASTSVSFTALSDTPPSASNLTVSGSPKVGQTLTGSYTYSDANGDAEAGTVLQWYRANDAAGSGVAAIGGANAATYVITTADLGKYLGFGVTPRNANAVGTSVRSAYVAVTHTAPVASNVAVTGTMKVGATLTGSYVYSDVDADAEAGSTYQWYRANDAAGTGAVAISGASALTYAVTAADVGKFLSFEVTPKDAYNAGIAVRSAYNAYAHTAPVASAVTVTGTAKVGQKLTGAYVYSDADGDAESGSTVQWYRADNAAGLNATAISGATASTYTLVFADYQKYLCFEVTPKDAFGTGTPVRSAYTASVAPAQTMIYCTVTAIQSLGGTVSVSGISVPTGSNVQVVVAPFDGYEIADVKVNGYSVGPVTNYTIVNISGNTTVSAAFRKVWKNPFRDVSESSVYFSGIKFVCSRGLFGGISPTQFSPNAPMSRAMIVTVLYRIAGNGGAYGSRFTDVPKGSWYEKAAAWASAGGIVNGVGGGLFDPSAPVSREQLVVMLYNLAKYLKQDVSVPSDSVLAGFPDAGSLSPAARDAMKWAIGQGLIKGEGGLLDPQGTASRGQVALVIERFLERT